MRSSKGFQATDWKETGQLTFWYCGYVVTWHVHSRGSLSYTTRIPHAEETHNRSSYKKIKNQRNVFPASGLIHRPFLAALISAYSAGLIPLLPAPRGLRVQHPADVVLAGPPLPAAAAAAPRTTILSACARACCRTGGGQVRRRAGVLGELAQRDAARDSRGVRAAGAALCAGP